MNKKEKESKRTIGLDMHPDVFCCAALEGRDPGTAKVLWVNDRIRTDDLESYAKKHLKKTDQIALEASVNSFAIAKRLMAHGFHVVVLESQQIGKIKNNYCNNDKSSAIKIGRAYLSGLCKEVWQPDEKSKLRREVFFGYRNSVRDTTRCRNRIRGYLTEHSLRLPQGTQLTQLSGLNRALSLKAWKPLQEALIRDKFAQLWEAENRRKNYSQIMANEVTSDPTLLKLLRLMGVSYITAFAVGALIGDVKRFAHAKKLSGYLGLAPALAQSGINAAGHQRGIVKTGRKDLRSLLIQGAQNALGQRHSPLHQWGWKLLIKKSRNQAVVAVARKLSVAIWHVLQGNYTPLTEVSKTIITKLTKISVLIGNENIKQMGYKTSQEFILKKAQILTQTT